MLNICHKCKKKLLTINRFKLNPRLLSIIFYGSDDFSLVNLKLLHQKYISDESNDKLIRDLHLVTNSKFNTVSQFAKQNQLVSYQFPYEVPPNHYDIGIVASFGHLIPKSAINACRFGDYLNQ